MEMLDKDGRLIASIKRTGGQRPGRPVMWLVYWGLAYSGQEHKHFWSRLEAQAWVRSVERRLQRQARRPDQRQPADPVERP